MQSSKSCIIYLISLKIRKTVRKWIEYFYYTKCLQYTKQKLNIFLCQLFKFHIEGKKFFLNLKAIKEQEFQLM